MTSASGERCDTGRLYYKLCIAGVLQKSNFCFVTGFNHNNMIMKKIHALLFAGLLLSAASSCKKSDSDAPVKETQADIASIDTRVQSYMTTYAAPGASLAISHNGKLVYAKGYGVADKASNEKVTTAHRFRMASVSKTLTSLAIMKLLQENKLTLNQKAFGNGAILGTQFGTTPYPANIANVTVSDLLHHTSGGWSNAYPADLCLAVPSQNATQLVDYGLKNSMITTPGTTFTYSNFGYIILGRIIEKLSGKTYAAYVKDELLTPTGAANTEMAGWTLADRKNKEVVYYAQGGEIPAMYNEPVPRNDAAMGWITTPTDILRVISAADSSITRPDILSSSTLTAMRTPSAANQYYACGMYVENDPVAGGSIWYHFGSLPGTQAVWFRMTNGWSACFVVNTRYAASWSGSQNAFTQMLLDIVADNTISWQDIDQFDDVP